MGTRSTPKAGKLESQSEDAQDIRDFKARRNQKEYAWESVKREALAADQRDLQTISASRREPRVAWEKVKRDLGLPT